MFVMGQINADRNITNIGIKTPNAFQRTTLIFFKNLQNNSNKSKE